MIVSIVNLSFGDWITGWILILSEYWNLKNLVNKPSEFKVHRKVESKPEAINIPCIKNSKSEIAGVGNLDIWTCKNFWELVTANFELIVLLNFLDIWTKIIKKNQLIWIKGENTKNHTGWQKNQSPKKKWEGSVLVVVAWNLCYNWFPFYTNLSFEILIEN